MYRVSIIKLILIFLLALNLGCNKADEPKKTQDSGKLKATASASIFKDILENIGGEFLTVDLVISSTSNHHSYMVNINDIIKVEDSDILVYSGVYFEGRLQELLEKVPKKHFELIKELPENHLLKKGGVVNPHFWFDVALMKEAISLVADYLVKVNPRNEIVYRKNEEFSLINLNELDNHIFNELKYIKKRFIVTDHDAFSYFGKRYNFETYAIKSVDKDMGLSYPDLLLAAQYIIENDIKVIFAEKNMPNRNILRLIEVLKERGYDVKIGGYLYTDSMMNLSYIEMMKANAQTIYEGLSIF